MMHLWVRLSIKVGAIRKRINIEVYRECTDSVQINTKNAFVITGWSKMVGASTGSFSMVHYFNIWRVHTDTLITHIMMHCEHI